MISVTIAVVSMLAGNDPAWDRQKAFEYLETRQQEWAAWKPAKMSGGACVSCHTGVSYLLARRVSGSQQPPSERDLIQGVRHRMASKETMLAEPGAEAILSLFALATQRGNPGEPVADADRIALQNLLKIQQKDGGWTWFVNRLHPVESEEGAYYGSTLAAWALSAYPASETVAARMALEKYLERESKRQPLHHRLAWVTFGSANASVRRTVFAELWSKQEKDGGFASASLGPWSKQEDAAPDSGSNAYATAWAAYAARESGTACADPGLKRALDWLEKYQDRATGAWHVNSMNRVHEKGSMTSKFMTDMTTGFAAAALVGCKREGPMQSTSR